MKWACFFKNLKLCIMFFLMYFHDTLQTLYTCHICYKILVLYIQELKFNNSKPSMHQEIVRGIHYQFTKINYNLCSYKKVSFEYLMTQRNENILSKGLSFLKNNGSSCKKCPTKAYEPHEFSFSNSPPLDSPRPRLKARGSKVSNKVQVFWNEENTSKF